MMHGEMGHRYDALFFPGDFVIFWNILVPLSVILNIRHFGLRFHEVILAILLALNPIILKYIQHNPAISWVVSLFLIMWIERVLRRWSWYRIYSWNFFKSAILVALFIVVPSLIKRLTWNTFLDLVLNGLQRVLPGEPDDYLKQARDLVVLVIVSIFLLHSFYFYSTSVCSATCKKERKKERTACNRRPRCP